MKRSRIFITCPKGLEPYLSEEVRGLSMPVVSESSAGVETEGDHGDAMNLNLSLRTGHRVLFLLSQFSTHEPIELYRQLSRMPWERYIPKDGYLCVTSLVDNPHISDSRYANLKCKDAIVDRIKEKTGRRPDSGPERSGSVVHLLWRGSDCSIFLDTSGQPLSKRGYRYIPLAAPMQETLAAAVVMATGWHDDGHFVNPMCGSGTLAIEAALIGLGKAPGLLRDNFGFMHLSGFDEGLWKGLRQGAAEKAKKVLTHRIIATDSNPEAVDSARKNAKAAGVANLIDFRVCDFADTLVPPGRGVVLLNPGYGERMGKEEELAPVYTGIGDFFKKRCNGYRGYIFTGNPGLAKKVGLRTKRRIPFFSGPIECRLLEYELYEGSRKAPRH